MEKYLRLAVFLVLPLLMAFDDEPYYDQSLYTPILLSRADLATSIRMETAQDFTSPGKLYIYNNKIFIIDLYTGIHIIDNTDRTNPQKTGFIRIPGVVDMSVRNDVLFADNAIDLVAIDMTAFPQINVFDRVEDVFPEHTPPDINWIPWYYSSENRPANTVIVAWKLKQNN